MGLKPPRKLDMTAFNILSRNIERNISATRILGGGESRTEQRLRTLEQQLKDVRKRGMLAGKWQRNTLLAIPAFFLLYFAASAVMVLLLNYGSGVKDIPDAFISKWQHSSSEQILILTADGVLLDNTAYPYTFSGIKILGQRRLEIKLLLPTQGSCAGGASLLDQNTLIMTLGSAYYNGNPDAEGIRFCTEVLSGSYSRN
jgi:hypothetical protein